jgi:hypothetical protein
LLLSQFFDVGWLGCPSQNDFCSFPYTNTKHNINHQASLHCNMIRNISSTIKHSFSDYRGSLLCKKVRQRSYVISSNLPPGGRHHHRTIRHFTAVSATAASTSISTLTPTSFLRTSANYFSTQGHQQQKVQRNTQPKYNKRSHKNNSKNNRNNNNRGRGGNRNEFSLGATTPWVVVTGTPPLSTLKELLIDVERIMKTELKTGIVDLDAAEKALLDQMKQDHERGEGGDVQEGEGESEGGKEGEEEEELLSNEPAPLPLWDPKSYIFNGENGETSLPSHMVIEAHMQVSTLYRQSGWYLRFPNRSCVHALLSHVKEADRIKSQYEKKANKLKHLQQKKYRSNQKKKNKMKNNGLDDDETELQENEAFKIEEFSWMNYDSRPLKCSWKEVDVHPFYIKSHAFHSKIDWIDDTVIRVENCPAESTTDDVRYFFRSYGLVDDRLLIHDEFDDIEDDGIHSGSSPRKRPKNAVQLAIGRNKVEEKKPTDRKFTPLSTNTFLVTFSNASNARAAVRDKQNTELMGRKVMLAQFSSQLIK